MTRRTSTLQHRRLLPVDEVALLGDLEPVTKPTSDLSVRLTYTVASTKAG